MNLLDQKSQKSFENLVRNKKYEEKLTQQNNYEKKTSINLGKYTNSSQNLNHNFDGDFIQRKYQQYIKGKEGATKKIFDDKHYIKNQRLNNDWNQGKNEGYSLSMNSNNSREFDREHLKLLKGCNSPPKYFNQRHVRF